MICPEPLFYVIIICKLKLCEPQIQNKTEAAKLYCSMHVCPFPFTFIHDLSESHQDLIKLKTNPNRNRLTDQMQVI